MLIFGASPFCCFMPSCEKGFGVEDDGEELEILILGFGGSGEAWGAGCWEGSAFSEGEGSLVEVSASGLGCVAALPSFASLLLRI